jgi:predicted MFS family arabinose efflux permease
MIVNNHGMPAADSNEPKSRAALAPTFGKLLVLAVTISSAATQRSLFSPFQELGKAALGLSDLQVSYVQGIAAAIPIALLSVPLGRAVDRTHRVRLLIIVMLMTIAGTVLTAYARSFQMLFLARMLAGPVRTYASRTLAVVLIPWRHQRKCACICTGGLVARGSVAPLRG